ncbi:MAG: hypothetical protein RID81_06965 [Sandaracinaceae bacterium]
MRTFLWVATAAIVHLALTAPWFVSGVFAARGSVAGAVAFAVTGAVTLILARRMAAAARRAR